MTISGTKVLTNAKGFTVYWFGPDMATKSSCNGSCAHFWPPVKGPTTAGTGVTGKLGTITRADGPGHAKGNGLNLSGGVWHEVTVTGTAAPAAHSSSSSSGGGYGY
jgi:predicted lipoprotein with Yx(FWY)xxD motif